MIRELTANQAADFSEMTFPNFKRLLELNPCVLYPGESGERWVRPLALGAEVDGRPAGLLLGGLSADETSTAEILSLFVCPGERRRGLAGLLLQDFERILRERETRRVEAVYMTGKPGSVAFERLIEHAGWETPVPRMLIYKCGLDKADQMPWFERLPAREGLEIFPWRELRPEEDEALRRSQAERPWIDEDLVPWLFDRHGFEEISSVGVRCGGEVVGWVINHAVGGGDLVRFTCSFIRKDLARRGRLVVAYSESIRRLLATPYRRCMFAVPMNKRQMAKFVERRCAPFGGQLTESRGAGKTLARDQGKVENET